ncbi:hypothetical protein RI129_010830 [Pyrocoelia pectoralis]|uniref:SET and MYND domain-containing protein 4 n=1 Tax=Pyrocoelia pectoralis TaxID=417401 RepID=A0AAN7VA07_9COLE
MECLFEKYLGVKIKGTERNLKEVFARFYSSDQHTKLWLRTLLQQTQLKSNSKSVTLRLEGNKHYLQHNFGESLQCYTKALCLATYDVGLIMSNRSALFFMTKHYQDCLSDIQHALRHDLPDRIKLKLLIRQVKCFAILQLEVELKNALDNTINFLSTYACADRDKAKCEIATAATIKDTARPKSVVKQIPSLKANDSFLFAASTIRLNYDKVRGRHVVAKQKLEVGDILFVEKPFVFAPIFNEKKELSVTRCYNCLKLIYSSIPCQECIKCIFCNEECRDNSWKEFHQWECRGMQSDLWYHLGIGFPALKGLIKGLPSGFCTLNSSYEADTVKFGDELDNYPYFNKLITNLSKMDDIIPITIIACVIVSYLKEYTNFFKSISLAEYTSHELITLVGARLIKHVAQLQCNSSVICAKFNNEDTVYTAEELPSLACGVYPSIGMMNHSCKPNIKIEYFGQVSVVKAAEEIYPDKEIFNCYGIDYRCEDKKTRQEHCQQLYFFTCNCEICNVSKT